MSAPVEVMGEHYAAAVKEVDELLAETPGWRRITQTQDDEYAWVFEAGATDFCRDGDPWFVLSCVLCGTFDGSEARDHDDHQLGATIWLEVLDEEGVISEHILAVSLEDLVFFLPWAVRMLRDTVPPESFLQPAPGGPS